MVPGYGYINIASVNINESRNLTVFIRSFSCVLQRLPVILWCVICFFFQVKTGSERLIDSLVIGFHCHSPFLLKGVGGQGDYLKCQRRRGDY